MKQKPIGFRELLEQLLPLDELPPMDRLRVQRALRAGVAGELERAALEALNLLEQLGAVRRLEGAENGSNTIRYQPRDAYDVITIQLPGPRERDGIVVFPRAMLPSQAPARLDQVWRLLRIEDPALLSDPRSGETRHSLMQQLDQVGRELVGATQVQFFPVPTPENASAEPPLDKGLAGEVLVHPGSIYYCPDLSRAPRLEAEARRHGIRSVALACVVSGSGEALGHLEARSTEADPFKSGDLAMIGLLADSCGAALERAARIEKLVFIDPLTSVYNRSYFEIQVQNEMARALREQSPMALLIADIDDFKSFNTAFGLEAGNQVLVQVALALKKGVRPFDTVARWGGEEFAVMLTAPIHADDVLAISERLRSAIERAAIRVDGLDRQNHRVSVTVSIGVALFPDHADTPQDLWRVANQALLKAKRPPKNQVVFYQPQGDPRFGVR